MCLIYTVSYSGCGHHSFLDVPLVTHCLAKLHGSPPAQCEINIPLVEIECDNVCATCSAAMYLMEKRYVVALNVYRAGGRVEEMKPLTAEGASVWLQWRKDRERFRAVGVDGGKGGELGQGWRKRKVVVEGRDFYRELGKGWMSDRYGQGRMLGWEEKMGFDGFLGDMGEFEMDGEKGLSAAAMKNGVDGLGVELGTVIGLPHF